MTETAPPRHIVIVGGGTAGWLTAAYLNKALGGPNVASIRITLVESADIGIIGVGEATIPTLRSTLRALDIPEWRLLRDADATFKSGIKFVDWLDAPATAERSHYYHLFEAPPVFEGYGAIVHWLNLRARGAKIPPYAEAVGVQAALCEAGLSPKLFHSPPYEAPVSYAYHLDAVKFAAMLRDVAVERGVEHVVDTVDAVLVDGEGDIRALRLQSRGDELAGDFFIDCSGFAGLLIGRTLGEPFVPFGDHLLCDRAVACPIGYEGDASVPRPYTTSTALPSGWMWEIDLMTRRGNGYVYSSAFASPDEAESELRRRLGPAADGIEARHLQMRIGRRRNVWARNCLAVGLSAGFVEPLESTGIYLVEMAVQLFLDYFRLDARADANRERYNQVMQDLIEHIRDFIVLHYCTTRREDTPFWRAIVNDTPLPDRVANWLELWADKHVTNTDIDRNNMLLFGAHSYFSIMAGMDHLPERFPLAPFVDPAASLRYFESIAEGRKRALAASPRHDEYVRKLAASALAPAA